MTAILRHFTDLSFLLVMATTKFRQVDVALVRGVSPTVLKGFAHSLAGDVLLHTFAANRLYVFSYEQAIYALRISATYSGGALIRVNDSAAISPGLLRRFEQMLGTKVPTRRLKLDLQKAAFPGADARFGEFKSSLEDWLRKRSGGDGMDFGDLMFLASALWLLGWWANVLIDVYWR